MTWAFDRETTVYLAREPSGSSPRKSRTNNDGENDRFYS